jgi:hypothetical protein
MCAKRKHFINLVALGAAVFAAAGIADAAERSAGGLALGEGRSGITDRAYVTAPPNWLYVVEKEPGSFLDCGASMELRSTDTDGRDLAALTCGVTLTETIVIPAASASAKIIIHY